LNEMLDHILMDLAAPAVAGNSLAINATIERNSLATTRPGHRLSPSGNPGR
jgi:hypothetical protein